MKNLPTSGLISIIFGVLILLVPSLLSYLVGVYLIIMGIMTITKR